MTLPYVTTDPILRIYLSLAQYPILRTQIRESMRRELFNRHVITPHQLEDEVRRQAINSQLREGLNDPVSEEAVEVWETRLDRIRNHLTDFYFASNLPYELFEEIVYGALTARGANIQDISVAFNPELAPENVLFAHAEAIEKLPEEQRALFDARLREIKVVLIRKMISDQLAYLRIAKDWLTIADLKKIRDRKVGHGKIGGKAAGMLLAASILAQSASDEARNSIVVPDSYYLGADLMYTFMTYNGLMHWNFQKYKQEDQIRAEYAQIQEDYLQGRFPPDIQEKLIYLIARTDKRPLIVRSSSLLEDNFGTSFAGKYDSFFCPNQGSLEENLDFLSRAIAQVYASSLNPDALLYRRSRGLQDYDERMAILIQVVQGEKFESYFMPQISGVAFSKNLYRWSPKIRREEGFVRLVWGLGTRAVDRVGNDYPRMVALSHPMLRPESSPREISYYSQRFVDLIDIQENRTRTLPIQEVLSKNYPPTRYLAQIYREGYLSPLRTSLSADGSEQLVITFDGFLSKTPFADLMREILAKLEENYRLPVDMEFVVRILNPSDPKPEVEIALLQCRPLSPMQDQDVHIPADLPEEDIVFRSRGMVPRGCVSGIRYVLLVTPEGYFSLKSDQARYRLRQVIGKMNELLENEVFICVGPGRWGTTTPDLGVRVGYADIYHARALVELSGKGIGLAPELSFGTHFFQDLIEARIFPLAVYLDQEDVVFDRQFFYGAPNRLRDFVEVEAEIEDSLRVIEVDSYRLGSVMELVMDDEVGQAVAYLVKSES
jgi:Pyruvate phosphate dikinase, AMP/ATP-binding domain